MCCDKMKFSSDLINWYKHEKRSLPWREDKDPYHVWISEIMLQQTRIEAVIHYYHRFMEKLPTILSLADVPLDELLKLWEGLGYYHRAMNLKKAAIMIMEKYDGIFPSTYEEIKSLPGIGEYTAGAISSICFSLPYPAVDGNVLRVITRLFTISKNIDEVKTKKEIYTLLKENMPKNSGDFNEGLMELGENICLPKGKPLCECCPIFSYCKAYQESDPLLFPVKKEKKLKREESYTVSVLLYQDKVAILKREEGLLKHLYEFPNQKGTLKEVDFSFEGNSVSTLKPYKHVFTHVIWNMTGYIFSVSEMDPNYLWVSLNELDQTYAIPTAFQPVLKEVRKYMNEYQ